MSVITIVEVNRAIDFPPVMNAIRVLLMQNHNVNLLSREISKLPGDIKSYNNFNGIEIPWKEGNDIVTRIKNKTSVNRYVRLKTEKLMKNSDFLWTTSVVTIRELRKDVYKYKHIFQLMELTRYGYMTRFQIKIDLGKIARNAYKVVVPEINRAYISRVWWNLSELPTILPNKPLNIDPGEITEEVYQKLEIMKNDHRKPILYLGGIFSDRNLETIAKTLKSNDGYVLYIVGKTFSDEGKKQLDYLIDNYQVKYLGGFNPPSHLHFVKHSYIGVLPYKPVKSSSSDELNALYCAPNKIFEYAGFGIPMIGSDVMGLKFPFEKWNMGYCYDDNSTDSILSAIKKVEANYNENRIHCKEFYESVDIEKIITSIIEE